MSLTGQYLPPTSSLPPIRRLTGLTEGEIALALRNLRAVYCPLRLPLSLGSGYSPKIKHLLSGTSTPIDSGYASLNEIEKDVQEEDDALTALRADEFERNFAVRWLTSLIARAEEICFDSEDVRTRMVEDAACILASFSDTQDDEEEELGLTRDFIFATAVPDTEIKIQLNDAPLSGTDHTDVGLQSWGASIILSEMMCLTPARFELQRPSSNSIIELGAGTGLISLTLAKLLPVLGDENPTVIATDYHSAVLDNLRDNITRNFGHVDESPVQICLLDWSAPTVAPPLDVPARLLVAADVIYAPEHARWLRDCATRMLAPDGVFWLMVTVRTVGKFEGIADTVELAFADCPSGPSGRTLKILGSEKVAKRKGIGRGDETGYVLYKIGWA